MMSALMLIFYYVVFFFYDPHHHTEKQRWNGKDDVEHKTQHHADWVQKFRQCDVIVFFVPLLGWGSLGAIDTTSKINQRFCQ